MSFRWVLFSMCAIVLAACETPRPAARFCPNLPFTGTQELVKSFAGDQESVEKSRRAYHERLVDSVARNLAGALRQSPRFESAVRKTADAPGSLTFSYIALSAGGQWGAFGSGFLAGWRERGNGKGKIARPDFELVTGVSTGAMMAPFVFAGREADDEALKDEYRGLTSEQVYRSRGLAALWSPSVYDTAPLKKRLERLAVRGFLELISEKAKRGGKLLVGTVELDNGLFRVFDLTRQASVTDESEPFARRQSCFVEAILAAGAIPIFLTPRYINVGGGDGIYVDGGARQHLFFRIIQGTVERLRKVLRKQGLPLELKVEAFVIVNGDVRVSKSRTANSLPGVGLRSMSVVLDELLRQSIVQSVLFADGKGWIIRGISASKVGLPPPGYGCEPSERDEDFSACFTTWLYDEGYKLGNAESIEWLDAKGLLKLATEEN